MSLPDPSALESTLAALAERAEPSPDGWAQIEARARRHDRRRHVALAGALSLAVVLAAVAAWPRLRAKGHTTGVAVSAPTTVATPAAAPAVGAAAWVSGGELWLTTGSGAPRPVPGSSPAADPAWSYDGHWVSYLRHQGTSHTELWVVDPDGTAARLVWTGKPGGIEWSPTADELAVSDAPAVGVGGLVIVAPDGSTRTVVNDTVEVNSFSWSPDGRSIAYATVVAPAAAYRSPLTIATVEGPGAGAVVTVLRAAAGDGIVVGPWWPGGGGLLYWVEPQYSKAAEAMGLPLMSIALAGPAPAGGAVTLATTLVDPAWLTWAPDGRLLVVAGGGAQPSGDKALELCSPATGACAALAAPAGTVTLDPAWSPDGGRLAFVVADRSATADAAWYATRRLWVADFDDLAAAHPVPGAGAGAADPSWSADGGTIGYTTATGVAAIGAGGGQPVVVSGSRALSGSDGLDGETAYGKTAWAGHAVWAPPAP